MIRENRPDPAEQCRACAGQIQHVVAAVDGGGGARHETSLFEVIYQPAEAGALDRKHLGHRELIHTRIGVDDNQNRELRRAYFERCQFSANFLENPKLRAPDAIAQQV